MISVIMSTYKEPENQLRMSIESILNQTYKEIEYIIILDNPENELHKKIIKEYQDKDKRIVFEVNPHNMGLTPTLNKALKLAHGDYIARMDADDISLEDRIENQLKYLESTDYDLIGGITQMIDENGNSIFSIKKIPTNPNKINKALKYGQCIAHPTWFGKRKVFEVLSGYREIPLCEDYDFTLRASLKGYKISNLNKTVLKYRMTQNSLSRNNLYEQYLFMRYITNEFSKGKIADITEAKLYVSKLNTLDKAQKYLKANVIFNRMLQDVEEKRYLSFIGKGFRFLFSSKEYLNKVYRFFMLSLNS